LIEPITMKLFQELKLPGATEEMGWFHNDESCGQHHTGRPDVMKCDRCKAENLAEGGGSCLRGGLMLRLLRRIW
jgi:hypothetical protein